MDSGSPREFGVITVRDVLTFALPPDSKLVAGHAGLGRDVTWATRLRAAPPAFGHISGGEIVMLSQDVLEIIDESMTLAEAIRQLATFGVSVIAAPGTIDAKARSSADAASLPLVSLPNVTDLGALERTAARTIAERRRAIQQQGQEAGRRFMELALAGAPVTDLADELSGFSRRSISVEWHDGRPLAFQPDAHGSLDERTISPLLQRTQADVQSWLQTVASASSAEPPVHAWVANDEWTRLVAPVPGRNGLLGSISLLVPTDEELPEDSILLSRAAAACAVTLAQEQATATVRREVELNVLDELLDGALRSEVALAQQAQRLGHDLHQTFTALIARLDTASTGPQRSRDDRWQALDAGARAFVDASGNGHLMWRVRNLSIEVVWTSDGADDIPQTVATLRTALQDAITAQGLSDTISIGIGRPAHGIRGIRQSHQEARQAITLGRRLRGIGHETRYEDLGIYRLLLAAEDLPELKVFLDESLSSLSNYDQLHSSNLVPTLEAYFAGNCSPKEAASILGVHRNTILYRLERIAEITGLDLDNPDVRLRLHLALYVRIALGA